MGTSSSSQALVMPSITCENCHMMCGFSGLPKFRQLVAPTGVAPEQATLRVASATACIAPRRGIEIAPAAVAIERHGESALRTLDADHARIARARAFHGVGLHHGIVLLPDPALAADVRRWRAGFSDHAVRSVLAELDVLRHSPAERAAPSVPADACKPAHRRSELRWEFPRQPCRARTRASCSQESPGRFRPHRVPTSGRR